MKLTSKNICEYSWVILLSLIAAATSAQGPSALIRSISFEGSDRLAKDYLLDYISTAVGASYNQALLDEDINRLHQLSAISRATYQVDTLFTGYHITYQLEGRGTVKPILGIGGVKDNFWLSLGASDYNLNGRNQILEAYYTNNSGRHNGKIFFQNDRIKGGTWGYALDAQRQATFEPVYFDTEDVNYNYTNHALGITSIKWIDANTSLQLGAIAFREDYAKQGLTLSESPGPIRLSLSKLLFKLALKKNHIRYDYFYRSGYDWRLNLQNVQTLSQSTPFFSLTFEMRKFLRPHSNGNLAFRLKAAIATNNDSPFAPFVLDSNFNVRGVGNRVDRGTAQLVLNVEYRHTLWHRQPWAVQGVAFTDGGSWRYPGGALSEIWKLSTVRLFYGLGVRIIYSKHLETTLRIDYGVDAIDSRQKGIVIGIGQYF